MYPPPTTSKLPGNVFKIQRASRIHQARRIQLKRGNNRRPRSGRKNNPVKGENNFACVSLADPQRGRILKRRPALNVFHVALLREQSQASGKLLDHAFFPTAQPRQINLRRRKFNSPILGLLRFLNQLGDMQQCLRGNAATIETHAAGINFGVDQRDLHAKISGKKGSSVAARSSADYSDAQLSGSFIGRLVQGFVHEISVRHPEAPRFYQRGEGSPASRLPCGLETARLQIIADGSRRYPWTESRKGCSNASATQRRKRAASAPSISR